MLLLCTMKHSTELARAFGKVLIDNRTSAHLTRMELAASAGLHLNAVSSLEKCVRSPNLQTVFSLSRALNMKASALIAEVEFEMSGNTRSRK